MSNLLKSVKSNSKASDVIEVMGMVGQSRSDHHRSQKISSSHSMIVSVNGRRSANLARGQHPPKDITSGTARTKNHAKAGSSCGGHMQIPVSGWMRIGRSCRQPIQRLLIKSRHESGEQDSSLRVSSPASADVVLEDDLQIVRLVHSSPASPGAVDHERLSGPKLVIDPRLVVVVIHHDYGCRPSGVRDRVELPAATADRRKLHDHRVIGDGGDLDTIVVLLDGQHTDRQARMSENHASLAFYVPIKKV